MISNEFLSILNGKAEPGAEIAKQLQALRQCGNLNTKEQGFIEVLCERQLSAQLQSDMRYLLQNLLLGDFSLIDGPWLHHHVSSSRKIQALCPWGSGLSEELYRYFVLPFRINNEGLDYQRSEFFAQLWPRIAGMSTTEAVLEINYFCYEEVRYASTDIRTLGPKALLKRGLGRCGEQATLLIALLRSVCIPARQCYVPRWSHTESNHAWVEAFTGNDWHYLGACEPEPELDRGWFTEALQRSTLIQTRGGDQNYRLEPVLSRQRSYSIINLTPRYAETVELQIIACVHGKGVAADAQISVLNGGEFFCLHRFTLGQDGQSESFAVGKGDILLELQYHQDDKCYEYWQIVTLGITDQEGDQGAQQVVCELQENAKPAEQYFAFCPRQAPLALDTRAPAQPISTAQQVRHDAKMKAGELAYQAKIQSFDPLHFIAKTLASLKTQPLGLKEQITACFQSAGCGAAEIYRSFQQLYPRFGLDFWQLLEVTSLKERALIDCFALADFLEHALRYKQRYQGNSQTLALWHNYVLRPNVDFEPLTAHRQVIYSEIYAETGKAELSPAEIFGWVAQHIRSEEGHSFFYYRSSLSPLDSFRLGRADSLSCKILTVALLRIFGYAARFNSSLFAVEWCETPDSEWQREAQTQAQAQAQAQAQPDSARLELPNYQELPPGTQISLAIEKQGHLGYHSLFAGDAHAEEGQHGENPSLQNVLQNPLPAGAYRLCYSLRGEDGNASGWVQHFRLNCGERKQMPILPLQAQKTWKPMGCVKLPLDRGKPFAAYIAAAKIDEPLYHVIHDISNAADLSQQLQLYLRSSPAAETLGDRSRFAAELQTFMQRFAKLEYQLGVPMPEVPMPELPMPGVPTSELPTLQSKQYAEDDWEEQIARLAAASGSDWQRSSFPKLALFWCSPVHGWQLIDLICGYSRSTVHQLRLAVEHFRGLES